MIIYGHRTSVREGKDLRSVNCESCGDGVLKVMSEASYFHVYWVPFFQLMQKKHVCCQKCGASQAGKKIPAEVKKKIKDEDAAPGFPFHYYSGIAIVGVIALFATISNV